MNIQSYIVFDLFGVIFHIDEWRALRYVGLYNVLKYLILCRRSPFKDCFDTLNKIRLEEPGEFQDTVSYKGTFLPHTICLWLKGLKTSKDTYKIISGYLEHKDSSHQESWAFSCRKTLLKRFFAIIALPDDALWCIKASEEMIAIIKELKKTGHPCYVLSNIDAQTYSYLKNHFHEVFALFDERIVSCATHLLKPDLAIFKLIEPTFKKPIAECIYVDDQIDNIKAAEAVGAKGILFMDETHFKNALSQLLTF